MARAVAPADGYEVPPDTAVATAEQHLTALLEGDFLLTDGRGSVSRFGARAAALFGWRSEEILGRPALDALAVSETSEKWRKRLAETVEPPIGLIAGGARHRDGHEFEVEWLVVPVWLRQSLELSQMLEVVGGDGSTGGKLEQLESEHPVALGAVRDAIAGKPGEDDDRLAGFVLVFRALEETPWADAALAPAPDPAAASHAPAVVGPSDEHLLRVGELEQELAGLRGELIDVRVALDEARSAAEQAVALAEETRMEAERWRREVTERARDVDADKAAGAAVEIRAGFDDVAAPLARIGLDGRFAALNPAFCELVGYTEAEFRRARWPSMADRENLVEHRRLQAQLAAGEIDRARIDTVYLHGQGLMVPVHGTLELVREDGRPSHLVLRVDA